LWKLKPNDWEKKMENDARKQEKVYTPEEVAAYLSDMSLDEWRKATATENRKAFPFGLTPDELAVLVKHWVNKAIDDEYLIFWGQCFGSSDLWDIHLDWKRVNEISDVLGDEATRKAVEEAYQQAAQDFDHNHWIVFRYGTREEQDAYQEMGGQFLEEFEDGAADRLASQVVKRVFREGPEKKQISLLKTELKRHSTTLNHLKSGPRHIIELFGVRFPAEVKRLVLSIGIEDAGPNSPNTFFKSLTLEQGKATLAALDETARKGESALKELVAESEHFVHASG